MRAENEVDYHYGFDITIGYSRLCGVLDASRVGLGCVLIQNSKVIAYASRKLKVYGIIVQLVT